MYSRPSSVTDGKQRDRNHPFSLLQCRQVGAVDNAGKWVVLGVVLGDLVDVDARGNVPCVSKIDTLDFSTVY